MRTACNRQTILKAPELLLIVRLVDAITNRGEKPLADNNFAQQTSSRTKGEIAEITVDQRDVLHWICKAVAHLDLVQHGRRKNAGLVYGGDVLAAAESLGQQITQHARRHLGTAFAVVIVVRTGNRPQFLGREIVVDAT